MHGKANKPLRHRGRPAFRWAHTHGASDNAPGRKRNAYPTKLMALILGLAAADADASARIPARQVAAMLYALALANRTVYTRDIVQRLDPANDAVIAATEHYLDHKALPLPAQMFALAAEELDAGGYGLSLCSLHAINIENVPLTPLEGQGLECVRDNPGAAFDAGEHKETD